MDRTRIWLVLAGVDGLMAVAAGAFGAHAVADPQVKDWLRTGAQYQMTHAAAAFAVLGLARMAPGPGAAAAALFGVGALVFAVALYLLALTGVRLLGAVAPLGGTLLLLGWAVAIWGAVVAAAPPSA